MGAGGDTIPVGTTTSDELLQGVVDEGVSFAHPGQSAADWVGETTSGLEGTAGCVGGDIPSPGRTGEGPPTAEEWEGAVGECCPASVSGQGVSSPDCAGCSGRVGGSTEGEVEG